MRLLSLRFILPLFIACIFLMAEAAPALASAEKDITRTLRSLIGAIRYGKDDLAAKQIDFQTMAKRLMADEWPKMEAATQKEFVQHLETLIRAISFAQGRDMFQHLDGVLYDKVRIKDGEGRCKSTIVVHRNYKKTEVVIDYVLEKNGNQWRVVDMVMLGESTVEGLREDQIKPLIKEGGVAAVMQALRDKVKEVSKKS